MKSANQTEIQKSFTQQAKNFESGKMNFSKKEYLNHTVSKIAPAGTDNELRDPSHVRCLSKEEMLAPYQENGLTISCDEIVKIPVILQNWMDHTATPPEVQAQIKAKMERDIAGGTPTGFYPYRDGSEIQFNQRWVLLIGHKGDRA